jgi:hypothetical protein
VKYIETFGLNLMRLGIEFNEIEKKLQSIQGFKILREKY